MNPNNTENHNIKDNINTEKYSQLLISCENEIFNEIREKIQNKFKIKLKPLLEELNAANSNNEIITEINSLINKFPQYQKLQKDFQIINQENKILKQKLLKFENSEILSQGNPNESIRLSVKDISINNYDNSMNKQSFNSENIKINSQSYWDIKKSNQHKNKEDDEDKKSEDEESEDDESEDEESEDEESEDEKSEDEESEDEKSEDEDKNCLLYTSPSPRD